MTRSPRAQALRAWIPAAILLVIVGVIVLATFAVQGSWWAEENPAASADQKAADGSTMLTDAGFDYVNVEGVLRVRIGDGALPAAGLGMADDAEKSAELRRPVRAVIAGGDDVYVVDDVAVVTAVTRGGALASMQLLLDGTGTWSDAIGRVSALAPALGWDQAQIDALESDLAAFNRDGAGGTFTAVIGPSTGGARISGILEFHPGSGATPVTIAVEPAG